MSKESDNVNEVQRWTAKRKATLVLEIFKGKTTVSEASRKYDLTPSEIESWIDEASSGMENALRSNPRDIEEQYEHKIHKLHAKIGELTLQVDALEKFEALRNRDDKK